MAKITDEDHQAYLDKNVPFMEQAEKPSGNWNKRSGHTSWRTRHGPAVVWWYYWLPHNIEMARYPDGSRGVAKQTDAGGWRRSAADGRIWIHGAIEILPNDVVFADGEQPIYTPPQQTDVPNLEADLAHDAGFLKSLQDDRFANAVYEALKRRDFYKGDECGWSSGGSGTARLIANLRGRGECIADWHPRCGIEGNPDDLRER